MIAFELEVISRKMDRFGWDRDRGTAAHDRIIMDWVFALQDYPLDEVREACKRHLVQSPKETPNEGHIIAHLRDIRREKAERYKAANPPKQEPEKRQRVSPKAAAKIMAEVGFRPKKMP